MVWQPYDAFHIQDKKVGSAAVEIFGPDGAPVEEISLVCEIDKGFKLCPVEGFIAQKKNHFQVTTRCVVSTTPTTIKTP
jgi:hypothetical protein